jgi:subtilisin family serine protease
VDHGPGPASRFGDHLSEDDRLEIPATAHVPLVVGSFVTKSQWTTSDGRTITRAAQVGASSSFSSSGPTSDGRFAPDLLAPGEFIASSLSVDAPTDQPTSAFFAGANAPTYASADDGVHGVLRGTSQAAPAVAGAIALLFAVDPMLTAGAAREILRATAQVEAGFSTREGFGRLDVLAALRQARGARGGAVSASRSSVGVSRDLLPPGDETTVVSVTPRDDGGVPLGGGHEVTIATTAGAPTGPVRDLGQGRYERTFVAHATRGQVAVVSATVDGVALAAHPSIYFVPDRAEVGRAFVARGGCSAAGAPLAGGPTALALIVASVWLARAAARRRGNRWYCVGV